MTYDQEPEHEIETAVDEAESMASNGQRAHPQFDEAGSAALGAPEEPVADDDWDAPIQLDDVAEPTPTAAPGGDVRAESVTISGSGANSIEAQSVSISQGGAAQVRATDFSVSQGGVALARAEHLTVNEDASAFAVLADSAEVHEGANVFLLVARSVSGDVRPVLDWRAAVGLGAGLAIALRLLRRR